MNDTPASPPEPRVYSPPPAAPMPAQTIVVQTRKRSLVGIFVTVVFVLAVLGSFALNIIMVSMNAVAQAGPLVTQVIEKGDEDARIAVYEVTGVIDARKAELFDQFVRQIVDDEKVKAVVMRVDSPGGSPSASDQIYKGVRTIQAAGKKVIVSMGGVAASGGYYVSAPADLIYAEPTTVTGSIGVIAMVPILKGTLEKIGAKMWVMRSTQSKDHKAKINPWEEPDEIATQQLQGLLDDIHEVFVTAVEEGRGVLSHEDVKKFANGDIWLGEAARGMKLVDEVGTLTDAVRGAAKLAKVANPHVVRYRRKLSYAEQLFGGPGTTIRIDAELLDTLQTPRIMLLWRP